MVGFIRRDKFNQQQSKNQTFVIPTVVKAQCTTGNEKYTDAAVNCDFAIDKHSQAYGENTWCFRHLDKDHISQPYITEKTFISSNDYSEYILG